MSYSFHILIVKTKESLVNSWFIHSIKYYCFVSIASFRFRFRVVFEGMAEWRMFLKQLSAQLVRGIKQVFYQRVLLEITPGKT
jgi:hypothetical protein